MDGLQREVNDLIQKGITDQELTMAQDYLTGNFVFKFQSNISVTQFLLSTELYHLGQNYMHQYPKIIREITQEKVSQVACQYLDTVNYATVVVGPTYDTKPDNQ